MKYAKTVAELVKTGGRKRNVPKAAIEGQPPTRRKTKATKATKATKKPWHKPWHTASVVIGHMSYHFTITMPDLFKQGEKISVWELTDKFKGYITNDISKGKADLKQQIDQLHKPVKDEIVRITGIRRTRRTGRSKRSSSSKAFPLEDLLAYVLAYASTQKNANDSTSSPQKNSNEDNDDDEVEVKVDFDDTDGDMWDLNRSEGSDDEE